MATWELRNAYESTTGADHSTVERVIAARGYRVEVPDLPHSGPVRVVAA